MKKYVLKVNSNYYGKGYIKEFHNDYGACNDFSVRESIFEATIYNTIGEAKNGIKYCLDVKSYYDDLSKEYDKQQSPKIWLDIYEIEVTETLAK